ncbi:RsbT co-antagonist protein RsbRA [Salimicrobium salexigens]|uniref:RsbT co-antagonist protein RsbR n=1 Tax=Salimicrobium salexigens TaxID=908941 RepID=A0ABY1KZC3_9BACI|nr:RsbT co-antagonist protein RsbRA [Salimicrobium salexigens]SIS84398.1 rsbT co-antagonist protein RsbR [Salimicrobium salexigens]
MEKILKDVVLDNSDEIVRMWIEQVKKNQGGAFYQSLSDEALENTNREFANAIFEGIQKGKIAKTPLDEFAEKLINLGWPLTYLTDGMQVFRRSVVKFIIHKWEDLDFSEADNYYELGDDYFPWVLEKVDEWVDPLVNELVSEYSGSWENIVSLQRMALQELSAPLIPVMDNITIMPLIGTIDTERAKMVMESLLDGVIKHNAEVVLIDITGVPVVDTMVAHHIIQAAEAVRLIGSRCILVGIRPEIAQTIVNLGIDLGKFPTKSSLRKGFQTALELTNREIVEGTNREEEIENLIDSLDRSEEE